MSEGLVFNMVGGGGGIKLQSIAVTTPPTKTSYFSGERFDPSGMVVTATYSNGAKLAATGYAIEPSGPLSDGMTSVTIRYTDGGRSVTTTQAITIRTLSSISVTTAPTKTAYKYGEKFSSAGMVITAKYSDNATRVVTGWTYSPTGALGLANTTITITYAEGGVSKTCTQAITVSNYLSSIAVTHAPTKTSYFTGETFNSAGMVVTATMADGSKKTVTGYTCSPTTMAANTTAVTVSYSEGGVTKTTTTPVTVTSISNTLASNSWATIRQVSDNGQGANYWSIGDRKAETLNGTVGSLTLNGTYYPFIVDFDHNKSKESPNAHTITFQFAKSALTGGADIAFVDGRYNSPGSSAAFRMNTTKTNSGGWTGSYMKKTLMPAFKSACSAALRAVIKPVTIYSDNVGGGSDTASNVTASSEEFYLPAEFEVHGKRSYANSAEQNYQTQLAYYKAGNSKVKYKHNATGTAASVWCRSAYYSHSAFFCNVITSGVAYNDYAYSSLGVAPLCNV